LDRCAPPPLYLRIYTDEHVKRTQFNIVVIHAKIKHYGRTVNNIAKVLATYLVYIRLMQHLFRVAKDGHGLTLFYTPRG
jgi:hypothetical protein